MWQLYFMLVILHFRVPYQYGPQVCIYVYKVRDITFCWRLRQTRFAVLAACAYCPNVSSEGTIWNVMHEWLASARSCTVNSELDPSSALYYDFQEICLRLPCDMSRCAKWMLTHIMLVSRVVMRLETASIVMTCLQGNPGLTVDRSTCIPCSLFYTSFKVTPAMMINFSTQTRLLH